MLSDDRLREHLAVGKESWSAMRSLTASEVYEAVTELLALRHQSSEGWQDISTAPRGKVVMLWKANTKEHYVAARIDGGHGPGWCTPDGFEIFNATHWQNLPAPPVSPTTSDGDKPS